MGFEPTNGSLGSYCLTTWLHPREVYSISFFGLRKPLFKKNASVNHLFFGYS